MTELIYDSIVIGAGLSGLTAAISLQARGFKVLVVERRNVAGGLCGTHEFDGREFVIGCNEFGSGLQAEFEKLGIDVSFRKIKTRFHIGADIYDIPFSPQTLINLLKCGPDLLRLAYTFSKRERFQRYLYLGPLVQAQVRNPKLADFINGLSYAIGAAPDDFALADFLGGFSKELAYGHDHPVIPQGGPGHLVQCMVRRFESLGGKLLLSCGSTSISKDGNHHIVNTSHERFMSRSLISSEGRWELYPANAKPSLSIGMFHLEIRQHCRYPEGFHTLAYFPGNVAGWLRRLDRGEMPEEFGFHVFSGDLPPRNGVYPLNLYFMCPRGMDELPDGMLQRIEAYAFERAERFLPGFSKSIAYQRFVSPKQYKDLYGLSSAAVERLPPAGFSKPDPYDPERGIHHIGNSVKPFGEHSGGAVLSGVRAAQMLEKDLTLR